MVHYGGSGNNDGEGYGNLPKIDKGKGKAIENDKTEQNQHEEDDRIT